MSKMERIFHGVFAECWPFILDDQATQVRIEQGLTEAFCEPVRCSDIWAGRGLRRCSRHLTTRLPGLEVRDDVLAEEAQGVEHLLVLRRPDGAQQDDFLDSEGLVNFEKADAVGGRADAELRALLAHLRGRRLARMR